MPAAQTAAFPETARTIESALAGDRSYLSDLASNMIADGYTDYFIADRLCDILEDAEG